MALGVGGAKDTPGEPPTPWRASDHHSYAGRLWLGTAEAELTRRAICVVLGGWVGGVRRVWIRGRFRSRAMSTNTTASGKSSTSIKCYKSNSSSSISSSSSNQELEFQAKHEAPPHLTSPHPLNQAHTQRTFSSAVKRANRSATRSSIGKVESQYAASASMVVASQARVGRAASWAGFLRVDVLALTKLVTAKRQPRRRTGTRGPGRLVRVVMAQFAVWFVGG